MEQVTHEDIHQELSVIFIYDWSPSTYQSPSTYFVQLESIIIYFGQYIIVEIYKDINIVFLEVVKISLSRCHMSQTVVQLSIVDVDFLAN